jgi:hypothetical protein
MDKKNKDRIPDFGIEYTLWEKLTLPFWRLIYSVKNWIFEIKMAYQRVVRGYDDIVIWNFDTCIARQIKEVCFILADTHVGTPKELTDKQWEKILLNISFGFGSYIEMRSGMYTLKDKEYKRLEKEYESGLKLFTKWHRDIWD